MGVNAYGTKTWMYLFLFSKSKLDFLGGVKLVEFLSLKTACHSLILSIRNSPIPSIKKTIFFLKVLNPKYWLSYNLLLKISWEAFFIFLFNFIQVQYFNIYFSVFRIKNNNWFFKINFFYLHCIWLKQGEIILFLTSFVY